MKSAKGIELGTIMDQLRYHLEIARRLFITFRFGCGSLVDYLFCTMLHEVFFDSHT